MSDIDEPPRPRSAVLAHQGHARFLFQHPELPEALPVDLSALDPFAPPGASLMDALDWHLEVLPLHPGRPAPAQLGDLARRLDRWGRQLGLRLRSAGVTPTLLHGGAPLLVQDGAARPALRREDVLSWPWAALQLPEADALERQPPLSTARGPLPQAQAPRAGPLRLLLASPRDAQKLHEVDYRVVAEALLELVDHEGLEVEVEELQPATAPALQRRLRAHRYDIVHIDGHGGQQGHLVFEAPERARDKELRRPAEEVPMRALTDALEQAGVRLLVMTACRSAAGADGPARATRTPDLGPEADTFNTDSGLAPEAPASAAEVANRALPSVVAMRWSLHVDAAPSFVEGFYRALLLEGITVGEAVRAGRGALQRDPKRFSGWGDAEVQDWVVPRLLGAPDLRFALPPARRASALERMGLSAERRSWPLPIGDAMGRAHAPRQGLPHGFFGRDTELHRLTQAWARGERVFVLHGAEGAGRTSLAKWWLLRLARAGLLSGRVLWRDEALHPERTLLEVLRDAEPPPSEGDLFFWDDAREEALEPLRGLAQSPAFQRQGQRLLVITEAPTGALGPAFHQPVGPLRQEDALALLVKAARHMATPPTEAQLEALAGLPVGQALQILGQLSLGVGFEAALRRWVKRPDPLPPPPREPPPPQREPPPLPPQRVDCGKSPAQLEQLSKVGLLHNALVRIFDAEGDVRDWLQQSRRLAPLRSQIPNAALSQQAMRLANLLLSRGYVTGAPEVLMELERLQGGPSDDLDMLRERVGLRPT